MPGTEIRCLGCNYFLIETWEGSGTIRVKCRNRQCNRQNIITLRGGEISDAYLGAQKPGKIALKASDDMTSFGTPTLKGTAEQFHPDYTLAMQKIPQRCASLLLALRSDLFKISSDKMASGLAVQQRTEEVRQTASDTLDALQDLAQSAHGSFMAAVEKTFAAPSDVNEQMLALQKQQIAWQRCQRELDRQTDPMDLISGLAEAGDVECLMACKAEITSYLGSKNPLTPGCMALIEMKILPLLPAPQRAALLARKDVEANWQNILASIAYARSEVMGEGQQSVLPAWDKTTVRVETTL